MFDRTRARLAALGAGVTVCCALVALSGAGPSHRPTAAIQHLAHAAHHQTGLRIAQAAATSPPRTALDVALTGTATASTEASGSPAANAIDGSASTQWCSTQWTGNVTVDLGRVRSLAGLGLTLGDTATTALVTFSAGSTADALTPVPGASQQSVPPGEPAYWPAGHGAFRARYVKVDVTDNDGTPPCIDELRLIAPAPMSALPDRGADLSFEPQERAAGARFTDNGVPGTPLSILTSHGLNYVRLRLWVNPPKGYSNLGSDLRMARQIAAAGDRLYLDIHYSDFWADPQHQIIRRSGRTRTSRS